MFSLPTTKLSWFFSLILVLLFLFSPSNTYAAGPHGVQPGAPIDDNGNVLITEDVANRLAGSGAGWVRINFRLGNYPSDTPEFYQKYDEIVNRLRSKGLQVVGLMSNESWHSPNGQAGWLENNWERQGGDGYNTYIDQYGYAFGRMAGHFEGRIKYWEIWNEPNSWTSNPYETDDPGGTFIFPSNFAAMLVHTHSQVHYYQNMDIQIISGGILGHDLSGINSDAAGADYLNSTYDVGINHTGKFSWAMNTYGSYPLDAIGQHIYIHQGGALSSSDFGTYLDYYKNVLNTWEGSGSSKKIWLTEFGWTNAGVSESVQSSNLNAAYNVVKQKSYMGSAIWFKLDDDPAGNLFFGVYRTNLTKKPSFNSLKNQTTYQGKRSNGNTVNAILNYFNNNGGMSVNGSPYDNGGSAWAHWWDYGYVQDFDGGSIGPNAIFDTGYRVAMDFWKTYLQGNNHSILRFPTSGEFAYQGGTRQNFQGGYMTWDPVNNVRVFPN